MIKEKTSYLGLFLWVIIGSILRLTRLTAKPAWTDEFATMVFSLGNTFEQIPFNQIVSADDFLSPLVVNSQATVSDVVNLILDKDNHPPVYFILSHLWIKLFSSDGEYVSLWGMRSLPVLFGIISIILIYWVGKKVFNSSLVGQMSAAMMSVSAYGIFISQEARHYTLALLFVIVSLGCFLRAYYLLNNHKKIPKQLIISWIVINSLGLSVHYFVGLVILAEALSLLFLLILSIQQKRLYLKYWIPLIWVALGTLTTGLIWGYLSISNGYGNEMIAWIQRHDYPILAMINPPFQLLSAWITMFTLFPVESSNLVIVILSGLGMLLFFIWLIPIFYKAIKISLSHQDEGVITQALLVFIVSLLLITFGITYGFGIDITRGARYSFIYFPAIILVMGIALKTILTDPYFISRSLLPLKVSSYLTKIIPNPAKQIVFIIWLVGLLGAITVLVNLGYQKYYAPDRLVKVIEQKSTVPALIVAPYISLSQTGEIMGIAWESVHQKLKSPPSFMILKQDNTEVYHIPSSLKISNSLFSNPLDIWPVNFYYSSLELDHNCHLDESKFPHINGYHYQRFDCH